MEFENWRFGHVDMRHEGLREGVALGRDKGFQEGFNEGFAQGFEAAYSLGYLNSLASTLKRKELGITADTKFDDAMINNPRRGLCQMCPDTKGNATKVQMSEKMEQFYNIPISEIVTQQRSIVKDVLEQTKQKMMSHLKSSNIEIDFSNLYS
ncbi:uncharacterized protein LOC111046697 isoform X2 [Nilaparvata lugens]|uniref:uncharacterized protein LOC111046697 isoform X2 n=1 Tax=Nilaparvata lugens TaxID=108931 RepID=UPI00193E30AB|nr:uncharacterized protein LOC111046697 isoform X2 [Nilaparvata lugens]